MALGAFSLGGATPAGAPRPSVAAAFGTQYRGVFSPDRVRALTVLPGGTVTFDVIDHAESESEARPSAGELERLAPGRWQWTAPAEPGLYPIQVVAAGGTDSVTLQAFVIVPYDRLEGERLNGYRIGRYPASPRRGPSGYGPPAGFIEVTAENENVLVSPHFQLKQFLCKQPAGSRKYVVLDERLLLALEHVLERVNEAGHRASTFHVMSGYRTPAYNRSIGNVRYSQHLWGAAADIFVDENGDGAMDDLNRDGRSDVHDADVLHRLIDAAATAPDSRGLIGGLGRYPATASHGPFVHLDVRGHRARW